MTNTEYTVVVLALAVMCGFLILLAVIHKKLSDRINSIADETRDNRAKIINTLSRTNVLNNRMDETDDKIKGVKTNCATLGNLSDEIVYIKKQIASLGNEIDNLKRYHMDVMDNEIHRIYSMTTDLEAAVKDHNNCPNLDTKDLKISAELIDMQAKIDNLEVKLDERDGRLLEVENQISTINKNYIDSQTRTKIAMDNMQNRIDALCYGCYFQVDDDVKNLTDYINKEINKNLEIIVSHEHEIKDSIKVIDKEMHEELHNMENRYDHKDEAISNLQEEVYSSQLAMDALNRKIKKLSRRLKKCTTNR